MRVRRQPPTDRVRRYPSEAVVHRQAISFLRTEYPTIIFRTDYAAGMFMTPGQAHKHSLLQYKRGWPDITIFEPRQGYYGLAIEVKTSLARVSKKDGSWATDHIREQAEMMAELRTKGWYCDFTRGYPAVCELISWYLGKEEDEQEY